MLISIVIPVHNEDENISLLINEISLLPSDYSYQIIVIDDASDDDTSNVLSNLGRNMSNLKIIKHEKKRGQSYAIASGVFKAEGEIIATMDGDGQNDPSEIPKLIEELLQNKSCRLVTGYRIKRNDTAWRIFSSKIANTVRSSFLKDNTPDTGCGLKVFYKTTFTSLPLFDHMHRFLPALVKMQGGDVISVEVSHRQRKYGKSNYGTLDRLWVGIIDLFGVYWLRTRSENFFTKEN